MPIAFSRSMRAFNRYDFRGWIIVMLAVAVVLAGWIIWAVRARVSLYEVTDMARVEVENAAHPIETQIAGRIVKNHLVMGERVQAGQILVELDADTERLQLAEEQTQPFALRSQVNALRGEVQAAEKALDQSRQTARAALDQARSQTREAEEAARFAHLEVERLTPLRAGGFISDLEFLRTKSEAQKRDAVAESMRLAVKRLEQEHRTIERDRQAQLERLKGEIRRAEGQMFTGEATLKKLEHEIDKRRIAAPVAGRIGDVAGQRPGTFVAAGAKLGAIIPDGGLKVIAYFPPQSALGRIQPGQAGRLRLAGFPWSQYGSLAANVTSVAGEPKDGRVRVELQIRSDRSSPIPVQHGLPGTVEIEVKKVSPLTLVLHVLEKTLIAPQQSQTSELRSQEDLRSQVSDLKSPIVPTR